MKPIIKQSNKKAAFTIVELLTVMSIIVILIGLLVPSLNMAKRYAKKVRQRAQFHSIDAAIELFGHEFDGYPPSSGGDPDDRDYCGAMKLCEAMMGQDLLGFHPSSAFRRNGTLDGSPATRLYDLDQAANPLLYDNNLKTRKGPYLPPESANAYRLGYMYTTLGDFLPVSFVLCDVYTRQMPTGQRSGMPILYYKADTANNLHDPNNLPPNFYDNAGNIYNFWDNQKLIMLGKPWVVGGAGTPEKQHALLDPTRFYRSTESHKITTAHRPYRADSYILLSAGYDGEYGTADDVFNFDWKHQD